MFRHVAILAAAVLVAVTLAQQLVKRPGADASPPALRLAAVQAVPPAAPTDDTTPIPAEVQKAADGHYWAEAQVNGRWIHALVDTGATTVALTRTDAERLGLDPAGLTYDAPVVTANGKTEAARVDLASVVVAGARVEHVPALVVQDGLSSSLLGMSYLGRLSRFEATQTSLILRP